MLGNSNYWSKYMIKVCFLLVLITTVVTSSIIGTNFQAYGVRAIWRHYENMQDFVDDIKNRDKNDNNMDWDKFRDSAIFKDADEDVRDCITLANKVGQKLGDYEVVRCFENANYLKDKYSSDEESQSQGNVSQQQQDENQSQSQGNVSQQQQDENQSQSQGNVSQQQQDENQSQGNVSQQQQDENQSQSQGNVSQQQQDENQSQSQGNVSQQQQDENQSQGNVSQTQKSASSNKSSATCDSSYPDVCITTYSAMLTCLDIPYRNFKVLAPDPHGLDSDGDGIGCEG
jgi:hypothetical protein